MPTTSEQLEDLHKKVDTILVTTGRIEERVRFQWWVIGLLGSGWVIGAGYVITLAVRVASHSH